LFKPDDPLSPPRPAFNEAWHAQVLALADTMVKAGHFSATDWAEALGAALKAAEAEGKPDTEETYYMCALSALERLSARQAGVSEAEQAERKRDWEAAYRRTPHGKPVLL
jgi:nitrile hydratase accessory protein